MPFTEHDGVRLHWREEGAGSPVLLVMGHRYSSQMWYPTLPALAAEHRTIAFDNRGTGESGTSRKTTIGELAADALAVMDAAGVESAHVFGVSMGGVIALELAMRRPARVTSLVLGATGVLSADKPRAPAFLRVLYHAPDWLTWLLLADPSQRRFYGRAATAQRIAADKAMLARDKSTVRGLIAQAAAIADYRTTREAIAGLTMPALVVHGDADTLVPFAWGEELALILPGARLVRCEGSGHNFMVAAPDKANAAVLEFLREVDRGAA